MRLIPFLIITAALTGWVNADSALKWDRKTVEAQGVPGEKTVRAEFGFTNVSKQPVVIDSVKPGCGCTTAALDKKVYQPGEKGQIDAIFTPGSRKGTQAKAIAVKIKGEPEPVTLTLVARIGDAVQLDPPLVFWRTGEEPRPKTIRVRVPSEAGLKIVGVSSNNPLFTAKVSTVKEGAEYQLSVAPSATGEKQTAVLKLQGVTRSGENKDFQAYAQVK